MTVLFRYLFREFLRAAAVCILGFLLLFLLIDFVDHAEKLLRHNAGLRKSDGTTSPGCRASSC